MNDSGPISRNHDRWQTSLRAIQSQPLEYCRTFPVVAQRWNDWWRFKADRPLIVAQVPGTSDIRWDKAFDLVDHPDEWVRVRRTQVERMGFFGEAIPSVRVDIGPVAMAAFMGTPTHLDAERQTSWQEPLIEAWETPPPLGLPSFNPWLDKVMRLMRALARDAHGRYLICLPDLTGAIDVLANMRTPERLCLDLYEHRDMVLSAANRVVDAWETVFCRMYDLALGSGAGVIQWVTAWADVPVTVPTCDFNALIGPDDFKQVCMPSLKEQARRAGLCVFHLDGPDAARHAETLAEDPDITAVQYTPGAGTPSALAKLPMFRMLQQHKVPLFVECDHDEVRQLAEALDPAGLAIRVSGLATAQQADSLIAWRDTTFA